MQSLVSRVRSRAVAYVGGVACAVLPAVSFAQAAGGDTFDPTSYVSSILATIAGILAIGGAVFAVHLAIKSTKWARRAAG